MGKGRLVSLYADGNLRKIMQENETSSLEAKVTLLKVFRKMSGKRTMTREKNVAFILEIKKKTFPWRPHFILIFIFKRKLTSIISQNIYNSKRLPNLITIEYFNSF